MKVLITIPENSLNIGCLFIDNDDNTILWDNMTEEQQLNIVDTLETFRDFFFNHVNDNSDNNKL